MDAGAPGLWSWLSSSQWEKFIWFSSASILLMIFRQNNVQIISWHYQISMNATFMCTVICDSALRYKEQQRQHFLCSKKQGVNHEEGSCRRGEWRRLILLANEWEDQTAKIKKWSGKSGWDLEMGGLSTFPFLVCSLCKQFATSQLLRK